MNFDEFHCSVANDIKTFSYEDKKDYNEVTSSGGRKIWKIVVATINQTKNFSFYELVVCSWNFSSHFQRQQKKYECNFRWICCAFISSILTLISLRIDDHEWDENELFVECWVEVIALNMLIAFDVFLFLRSKAEISYFVFLDDDGIAVTLHG